ncbi:hypothetical protein CCMSSC00406_0007753 [Pleurotus cornucopiae]|uniref:Uncharacterized protein n=1 Tax=Pleurotus cornucopiae TaxID=5321 RepID=A0ACB7J588_PLECO|nr:hypothetical protein CCMSSC00406_0007753 [Pleurotus cornucopiae]
MRCKVESTVARSPLRHVLPNWTHLSIEDADIANLGMTACITAPRLKAITLLHKGKADAKTAAPVIAAIYASLAPFPLGARSQFKLHTRRKSESGVSPLFELKVHGTGNFEAEGPVPPAFHYYSDDEHTARDPLSAFRRNVLSGLRCTTDAHFDSMIDVLYALGGDAPAPAIPDTDRADDDVVTYGNAKNTGASLTFYPTSTPTFESLGAQWKLTVGPQERGVLGNWFITYVQTQV